MSEPSPVSRLRAVAASLDAEEEAFGTRPALVQRHRRVRPCARCHGKLVRIARTTALQFVVSCFGSYPYLCEHCGTRTTRSNYKQLVAASCLAAVTLGFIVVGLGYATSRIRKIPSPWVATDPVAVLASKPASATPAAAPHALTNEDILEFVRSNMTSTFVMTVIREEESHFQTDAKSLTALKRQGVSEDIILAMVQAAELSRARADMGLAHR